MSTLVGKVLAERFQIVRLIGEGGMGAVYEAHHVVLPRRFAIKVLRDKLSRDKSFVERFRREAIAAARIEHPNVIYITDFGSTPQGSFFLVMEYLEGMGLEQLLARYTRLPLHRALPILAQVADALHYAHLMDVVHRDLKPENILLCNVRGQQDIVKLLDFGIAKLRTPEFVDKVLTVEGQVFGTAEYMSPEQALGETVDGRADLYAVGCLAFELITGRPPFTGRPAEVLQAHVNKAPVAPSATLRDHRIPEILDALVLRCLAKDPAERYQSGAELRHELLRVQTLLFSVADESPDRQRLLPVAVPPTLPQGGELLVGQAPLGQAPPGQSPPADLSPRLAHGTYQHVERLREAYHSTLRELGIALVQQLLAPPEVTENLERLLVLEEEVAALTGTIAVTEQNFDRIRYEYGQQEKRLRFAILDLSMAKAQLQGKAATATLAAEQLQAQLDDLHFQIGALSKRCQEVETERGELINDLASEVKGYRQTRQELEQEIATTFQQLHAQVEGLRGAADKPALQELYLRLDQLLSSIEQERCG